MSDAEKVASRILVLDGGEVVGFGTLSDLRAQTGHDGTLEDVVLELLRRRKSHARP
jgi:ABC-type multidrug transport system ATPase subunit